MSAKIFCSPLLARRVCLQVAAAFVGSVGLAAGCRSALPPSASRLPSPSSSVSRAGDTEKPFAPVRFDARGDEALAVRVRSAAPVGAKTESSQLPANATLDDYRSFAALHHQGLKALYHEWQASAERGTQRRVLPEPNLTYSNYIESVETRTGPQENAYGISQRLPWIGKILLDGSIADREAQVAYQRFLAVRLALDYRLRTSFAEYYYLGKSIEVTEESVELLTQLERVARERLAAGAQSHPDVVRLQIEIGRLEDDLESARDLRRPMSAQLNSLLSRRGGEEIAWPESLPDDGLAFDPKQLLEELESDNPELVALQHEVDRALLGKKRAFQEYFPDVSVGVQTIDTGSARVPGSPDSGDDPWIVTFNVEVPLWYYKYRAGEREAAERLLAKKLQQSDKRHTLRAALELALHHYRRAGRRMTRYRDELIPKAADSLSTTEAAFRAGSADFLALIDAERVLLEFQLEAERALADRLCARANIDRLIGRSIIPPPKEVKS